MKIAAIRAVATVSISLLALAALHVLSPEFDPAWRMVSEYANGRHGWVLALFFAAWGASSLALVAALRDQVKMCSGKVGLVLLTIAAIFDINHPLHDLVGNVAIPAFTIAAVSLKKNPSWKSSIKPLSRLAHACWISVVLLIVSFIALIVTYVASDAPVSEGAATTTIPDGVIALVGWTNRLLVVVFAGWTGFAAWRLVHKKP